MSKITLPKIKIAPPVKQTAAGAAARQQLFQKHLAKNLIALTTRLKLIPIKEVSIECIREGNPSKTPWSRDTLTALPYLILALENGAFSVIDKIGSASGRDIDAQASEVFDRIIAHCNAAVVGAEAKDSVGNIEPGPSVDLSLRLNKDRPGISVDVVDGTKLAAAGLPEAVGLAAIVPGLKAFPDLQALALLIPAAIRNQIDLSIPIDQNIENICRHIARGLGKKVGDLSIMTHSVKENKMHHQGIIDKMRALGIAVIVPEITTIEAPYVLNAFGIGEQAVDAIIGVFGLPETIFNTILAKNLAHFDKELIFRIAPNSPIKRNPNGTTLEEIFTCSREEQAELSRLRLNTSDIYDYEKVTIGQTGGFAVMVGITDNHNIWLRGVRKSVNQLVSESLVTDPLGNVYKIEIQHQN